MRIIRVCREIDGMGLRKIFRYSMIIFKPVIYYNLFEKEENQRGWS